MWRFELKGTTFSVVDKVNFKLELQGNIALLATDNKYPLIENGTITADCKLHIL